MFNTAHTEFIREENSSGLYPSPRTNAVLISKLLNEDILI